MSQSKLTMSFLLHNTGKNTRWVVYCIKFHKYESLV